MFEHAHKDLWKNWFTEYTSSTSPDQSATALMQEPENLACVSHLLHINFTEFYFIFLELNNESLIGWSSV